MKYARTRPANLFSRFTILVISGYFSQVAAFVLTPEDRLILGVRGLDARPLFVVVTVAAVLYAFEPRLVPVRWTWLVLLTFAAWGRALSLLFIGSPEITREREVAGFLAWFIVWAAGILATFIIEAGALLRSSDR